MLLFIWVSCALVDDVLFRIDYSHPEVSYVTKAKAVWTSPARFKQFGHFSWHCLHPIQAGVLLHNCPVPLLMNPYFPKCYWKARGQGHHEYSGVTVGPHITMVMPKQHLTAKSDTKFDSWETLSQLPTSFPLLHHKKSSSMFTPHNPNIHPPWPSLKGLPHYSLLCEQTVRHWNTLKTKGRLLTKR